MSSFLGKEEFENLQSLKRDLVNPVKAFVKEVHEDTVGDAKKYYSAKAQNAKRSAELAREKTREQMAAIRREQAQLQKRRKAMQKRAAIVLALLALFSLVLISVALSAHADEQDLIELGTACLGITPPDYEKAAEYYRRAGYNGDTEGYYRLAQMYEAGLLVTGNPCTDDLTALGAQKALQYYALAARGGYEPAQNRLSNEYKSISQEEAEKRMNEDTDYILLDVRSAEEYDGGHIPGAICIPVETITEAPEELSDFDQMLLIYCRSGRRSKLAAQKLASLGYTDVLEFGGILDWKGEIVSSEEESK